VSKGKLNSELEQEASDGFTRWGLNDEGKIKAKHSDGLDELLVALTQETGEAGA